jgi:hypothetical protein
MFATVRRYAGLSDATVAALGDRAADIAAVLASVPGSRDAHLIRTRDGLIVVTIGADEPCLVESGRRFRAWVDDQIRDFREAEEPDVWSGPLLSRHEASPQAITSRDLVRVTNSNEGEP